MTGHDTDESVRLKVVLIATLLSLTSVVLFWIYAANPELAPWKASLLQNVAGVLLISGVSTFLTEWHIRRDQLREFRQIEARILRAVIPEAQRRLQALGLADCASDAATYQYRHFIEDARELQICVNDGKAWLGNNHAAIKAHFLKDDSKIELYLVAPTSHYLAMLASKTNASPEVVAAKIVASSRLLMEYYLSVRSATSTLRIYWHHLPVVHALYMSEKVALLSPYTVSRPRSEVPLLMFENTGPGTYYRRIREDIARIADERDTILVFEAQQGKVIHNDIAERPVA